MELITVGTVAFDRLNPFGIAEKTVGVLLPISHWRLRYSWIKWAW